MLNNVNGSDVLGSKQLQQKDIQALINAKKLQNANPYNGVSFSDNAEISDEALAMLQKDAELEKYKAVANELPDVNSDKVAKFKELFDSGKLVLPSNDKLAESLLGNADFKALIGL